MIAANGEATVRATLESHFISPMAFDILLRDPFTPTDFEALLSERQSRLPIAPVAPATKTRMWCAPSSV